MHVYHHLQLNQPSLSTPLDQGWWRRVSGINDLLSVNLEDNYRCAKTIFDPICLEGKADHSNTLLGPAASFLMKLRGDSLVGVLGSLMASKSRVMDLAIEAYGFIYVNINGGWQTPSSYLTILREVQSLKWPDIEPRYLRWPNGKHYYIKVGDQEVVVDGQSKWNTIESAKMAYAKWIKEN